LASSPACCRPLGLLAPPADALLIDVTRDQAVLRRRRRDRIEPLAIWNSLSITNERRRLAASWTAERPGAVIVRLPPDWALVRRLSLPAAAAGNLRQVLRFDLDRQTPFAADQVYFDHQRQSHGASRAKLELDLAVVPRGTLDEVLQWLLALGLEPSEVGIAAGPTAIRFNFLTGRAVPRRRRGTRLNLALAALALVLAIGALAHRAAEQSAAIDRLSEEIKGARATARRAADLAGEIDRLGQELRYLADQRDAAASLPALAALVKALPDGSWAGDLELDRGAGRVRGYSASAASLIAGIDGTPPLRNAQFRSPIVAEAGRERFELSFDVTGAPAP
jgi:general secretion pathway protein L